MAGQLQVRQRVVMVREINGQVVEGVSQWGSWLDVQSSGWLVGFMFVSTETMRFQYELREEPEKQG